MNFELKIKKEIFNDAYYPSLVDYRNRFEVYYGGAGSGKSVFLGQKLVLKALTSKRKILVVRKFATTLKDSCFDLILTTLAKFKVIQFCTINKSTFTIALPNGSIFLFKGLDDSEKIKSITDITDIWIEEATEIELDSFTQLDLRLRAKEPNLQMFLSLNPVSKVNWVYKHFFEVEPPSGTKILKTTYKDNKFLPQDYINSLEEMARTNPTYHRIYALGEFCSLDKLIYSYRVEEFDKRDIKGTHIFGLDFGYVNDASALVSAIITEDKKLYIYDEMYKTGLLNDAIAKEIIYRGIAKEVIIADCAEQKSIEEIKRLGVPRIKPATKGQGSILQGIQKIQQYEIVVHPSCENTIIELQNYAWKKDKHSNEYTNEPIDKFNHILDALRYGIQAVEKQKATVINKKFFGL